MSHALLGSVNIPKKQEENAGCIGEGSYLIYGKMRMKKEEEEDK